MLPTAQERDVTLQFELGANPGIVLADAAQLDRALLNVLSNAVKFTPNGGRVTVTADRLGDEVVIAVSDTGVGIPLEEQANLFTPFFRSSTAVKSETQGTGLGLVIVKNIVEGHKGTIRLDSTPGEGTTVTIAIPAAPERTVVQPNVEQSDQRGQRHDVDSRR
jgi:signal transduction histidine kinase